LTRNAWLAAIGAVIFVAIVAENIFETDPPPKITSYQSIYGNRIDYSDTQIYWSTGHPSAYLVQIPVKEGVSPEDAGKEADQAFQDYAGFLANDMGFQRVVIKPDDGVQPSHIRILGFKLSLSADIGTGPLNLDVGVIAYDRHSDGTWSRDGAMPDAPVLIRKFILPSGAVFAWTGGYEDFPFGQFIYDCLSCTSANDADVLAKNLYTLLKTAFVEQADSDHLKKANVAIFLGPPKECLELPNDVSDSSRAPRGRSMDSFNPVGRHYSAEDRDISRDDAQARRSTSYAAQGVKA
jgi:hypothetical protein